MTYKVVFAPEAEDQLAELYRYIAVASSEIATRYTNAVVTYCEGLAQFPYRGTARSDIRPGLRTTSYKKRTVIAFAVFDRNVAIIGVFYGGRDYETILRDTEATRD
ncbi:type II toxin-antitoxin system RelE/ParE family toxin [Glaciibacter superstes]|uniref:type II toxin-antitoxin system RelE/ParE family toxin n=1 Tax=Glaciibacter superstes TaxID=501023 RepID=UPI0003B77ABD|nr:type II toxin-antitoxin system RelE/ParE family toxin [Glaciibacter superstes]